MDKQGGEVVYKNLSFRIVGILFDVYNELGYGHPEKYYQKAVERGFTNNFIEFRSQAGYKIIYKGSLIGRYYLDFLVENKIVLEIKKGAYYSRNNIEQIKKYLAATDMKLAILANFTPAGVKFLRVLNINNNHISCNL